MLTLTGHTAPVRSVAYSPDGQSLVSGGEDGTLRLWDLSGRRTPIVWEHFAPGVEAATFTPDGSRILAGLSDGRLVAVAGDSMRPKWHDEAHPTGVRAVAVHPDGTRAFTAGWDRDVCVWPLARPKRARLCPPLQEPAASLALSADGSTLAVGLCHGHKIHLIDTASGKMHTTLESDEGAVFALAFAPRPALLAAGDTCGRVLLWDPHDPRRPRVLEGHSWTVFGIGFTGDGRRLVTVSADNTARVWDIATGRPLQTYEWHAHWVKCLALSPDGLTVATGGEDRMIKVWDLQE